MQQLNFKIIYIFFLLSSRRKRRRRRTMPELILNLTSLRSLNQRRWKILTFWRLKRSQLLLQVNVLLDLHWHQGTKATGSRQPALVKRYKDGASRTVPADGLPEFAIWVFNCLNSLLWHCCFIFRTQAGMWTVLLLPMLSVTFGPKLKVKELTSRKRTRKMRAGWEKWVFVIVYLVSCDMLLFVAAHTLVL